MESSFVNKVLNWSLADFLNQPTYDVVIQIMAAFGWVVVAALLIMGVVYLLLFYKQHLKYMKKWEWVLLAVDIPALNVQTPKAVEQMFSHLAGSLDPPNIKNKFRVGFKQRPFSFEIISIEGYIQFLIRTEMMFRDLVEAAIYAQYPEAEIVEVEDYVDSIPTMYPNETHDVWAGEFKLEEGNAYPIRTYQEFEHTIAEDTVLKDPMGTFLESLSRIGPGEQMWFQIVVEPATNSWKEEVIELVKKLIGERHEPAKGSTIIDAIGKASLKVVEGIGDEVFNRWQADSKPAQVKKDEGPRSQMLYLSPGAKNLVEAIEDKIKKIGFETKMRGVYVARKEAFQPERGIYALMGAIKQFNVPNSNSIVPKFTTETHYFFKNALAAWRKRRLISAYKKRDMEMGLHPFILNIEELATVWHFPMSHVKTPLVQKASGKVAEPPSGLPVERFDSILVPSSDSNDTRVEGLPEYDIDAGPEYKGDQQFG